MLKYVIILHFFLKNIYEQSENFLLLQEFSNNSVTPNTTISFFGSIFFNLTKLTRE